MRARSLFLGPTLTLLGLVACAHDPADDASTSGNDTSTSGDGDGDGDPGDGDGGPGDGDGGPGDGDGDGDGDPGGPLCSQEMPCPDTHYCNMGGDCGVFGEPGVCMPRPEGCDPGPGGSILCSCGEVVSSDVCSLHLVGEDEFRFGGCSTSDPNTFACGDQQCDVATEFCAISFNDVQGPNEPEYFAGCNPLPPACPQGDCSCMDTPMCYDGTGNTVVFYPGG